MYVGHLVEKWDALLFERSLDRLYVFHDAGL